MAIKFKILLRKNPQDVLAQPKYYAAAVGDGEINFEELAAMISLQCTVTESDCLAVLSALETNMEMLLVQGKIVKLGRIGTFQVGLSSIGNLVMQNINASSIVKTRIIFRPGKKLRNMLKALSFKKAS